MAVGIDASIVIPTYDRPRQLRGCLRSLTRLKYDADRFEVLVVDDGSLTPLDVVVAPFKDALQVTLLRQANAGPGQARNAGARAARGRWLAFTDDDCRPDPDWLTRLGAVLDHCPDSIVGGRTVNLLPRNPYSAASHLIVDMAYDFYNGNLEAARFFASNNMAVPRDLFLRLGGFHTDFFRHASEDRELCDRWRHLGHPLRYAADAVVRHGHVLGLRSFSKQHFAYGRGAYRYHELRRARGSGRMLQDMGFHLRLFSLTRKHLSASNARSKAAVVVLLPVWQVFNAAGFFYERFQRSPETTHSR